MKSLASLSLVVLKINFLCQESQHAKARFFHHEEIRETCFFPGEFEQCIFQWSQDTDSWGRFSQLIGFFCAMLWHTHTLDNRQRHQISWGLSRFFKPDVGEPSTLDCVLWVTDVALDVYGITWLPKEHCHWMMISTKLGRENLWGIHGYLGCYVGFHLDLLKKMEVSKIIFMFTSGEMIQFDQHIFEMGGSTIN